MSDSLLTLTGTVVLAALSGLTILGVNRPAAYARLFWFVYYTLVALANACLLWDTSNRMLVTNIESGKLLEYSKIEPLASSARTPLSVYIIIGIVFFYAAFVRSFPFWLLDGLEDSKKGD